MMTFGAALLTACIALSIASIYWPPRGDGIMAVGDAAWLAVYLVIMVWGGVHVGEGAAVVGWGLVILAAYSFVHRLRTIINGVIREMRRNTD